MNVPHDPLFPIIHEDESLLVVHKPADLVCHPTKGDIYSSLISRVRLYLGEANEGQLINRLDRETSGVVLIAKSKETARALRIQWEARTVIKKYHAIVYGWPAKDQFDVDAPLGKDTQSEVVIKNCVREDGHASTTTLHVLKRFKKEKSKFSMFEVSPRTGRKHQIRIHLQYLGHSIVGDKLYGLNEQFYLDLVYGRLTDDQRKQLLLPCHALHAQSVTLVHQDQQMTFESQAESWFQEFHKASKVAE
jgi:23S rRNA pseudouridine1911/1915/1917 synthase